MTKTCTKCNTTKNVSEFQKLNNTKDGYNHKCKCCIKEYYNKNKEQIRLSYKIHYIKNKKNILGRNKKWRDENKEKMRNYAQKWAENNKERVKETHRVYAKNRRQNDITYKLEDNIRRRIRSALKHNSKRAYKSIELLGCTIEDVRIHLESQFTEVMSWDNHGTHGWHIDHIRPCASFDLSDPKQQKQCFSYKNLQPLWAYDNISKSDKWEGNKNE